jgi:hypothetical protein
MYCLSIRITIPISDKYKKRWLDERRAKQTTEEYQSLWKLRPTVTLRAIWLNFKRYWAWILDILSLFINLIETHSQKRIFNPSWVLI